MDQVCRSLRLVILTYIIFIFGVNGQIGTLTIEEGNIHSTGSTISCQGIVPISSTATFIVRWLFNTTIVCTVNIVNNVILDNTDVCNAAPYPSGSSSFYYADNSVIGAELSNGTLNLSLTYNKPQFEDYILEMKLFNSFNNMDLSAVIPVTVTNCTDGNDDTGNVNLQYNDTKVVQCTANKEEFVSATCLSNASLSIVGSCTPAPNPPLPGWAIFLIILGALVLVFGGLFIAWWCIQAFRECLHGVSECFPEDHCCGKGSC